MKCSIDEITFTFQAKLGDYAIEKWQDYAKYIISNVEKGLNLEKFLGKANKKVSNLQGYDSSYEFGNPTKLFVAFHTDFPNQGILFRFTARGVKAYQLAYQNHFGKSIEVFEIAQKLEKAIGVNGKLQASRVDLTQDFFNETDTVNSIYKKLENGIYELQDSKGHKSRRKVGAYINDGQINTIYFGVRQSDCFARVYNKREEQISKHGPYEDEAKKVKIWVRFEAQFKNSYAHQLGARLLKMKTAQEEADLVNSVITDLFRIRNLKMNKYINLTAAPMRAIEKHKSQLLTPKKLKEDLETAKQYYFGNHGGFQNLLYKIRKLQGEKEFEKFFDDLKTYQLKEFKPSDSLAQTVLAEQRKHKKS